MKNNNNNRKHNVQKNNENLKLKSKKKNIEKIQTKNSLLFFFTFEFDCHFFIIAIIKNVLIFLIFRRWFLFCNFAKRQVKVCVCVVGVFVYVCLRLGVYICDVCACVFDNDVMWCDVWNVCMHIMFIWFLIVLFTFMVNIIH